MPGPSRSIAFDTIAADYDASRGGLVRGASFARSFAPHLTGAGPVLEVGVGTGAVALPLQEQVGRPVVGVDLSLPMLALAAHRLPGAVAQADAYRLPFAGDRFDDVVLAWVLQLVPDAAGLLRECARVVRPGGRILVVVASPQPHAEPDPDFAAIEQLMRATPGYPTHDERPAQSLAAARTAGLTIVEATHTEPQTFEEAPATTADLLARRKFGWMLDLDDDAFATTVQPIIDALLALPDPDRPRPATTTHPLLVLERPI